MIDMYRPNFVWIWDARPASLSNSTTVQTLCTGFIRYRGFLERICRSGFQAGCVHINICTTFESNSHATKIITANFPIRREAEEYPNRCLK